MADKKKETVESSDQEAASQVFAVGKSESVSPYQIDHSAPLSIGHQGLYRLSAGDGSKNPGELRPATIVRVWQQEYPSDVNHPHGYNIVVLVDGTNDFDHGRTSHWVTSVRVGDDNIFYHP